VELILAARDRESIGQAPAALAIATHSRTRESARATIGIVVDDALTAAADRVRAAGIAAAPTVIVIRGQVNTDQDLSQRAEYIWRQTGALAIDTGLVIVTLPAAGSAIVVVAEQIDAPVDAADAAAVVLVGVVAGGTNLFGAGVFPTQKRKKDACHPSSRQPQSPPTRY
jgi:hypothetical protein